MNIPLLVKPFIDKYTKNQKLEIWYNGHVSYIDAPFNPYFYSLYKLKINSQFEECNKILFSNLQPTNLYKYSFQNTQIARQYQEEDSIEAKINYLNRILIDEQNFFIKYQNTESLKIMYFDIETDTTGMFPTPERNAIIAIGCKCGSRKRIFMSETYDNDKIILNKFFDFIKETDPDVITHYNGDLFDIPYIIERMKINHIPLNRWSRNNKDIHQYKNTINIGGRVSFDLYHEAQHDQTLYGIKNLKMKTLAKFLNIDKILDIKEIEYSKMRELVNTTKLRDYLISDVEITEKLFNIYFKNVKILAEMNKIPLNLMIGASASFLPNIIHGRAFQRLNIVSDKINGERHLKYIKKKQGALVNTFNPGLYNHPIYKVDFASQYPRICQTFNFSPETVRIIRYDNYTGRYKFDISNPDKYIFNIPDETSNKNIIIAIDMTKRGFLSQFMENVLTERFDIKKRMKTLEKGSPEYEEFHVRQNALKIICNVQTGYHGQEFALFGDLGTYCAITGLGRYYLQLAMEGIKCQ
jgi:DNA polymerase elongation subunit (family B)